MDSSRHLAGLERLSTHMLKERSIFCEDNSLPRGDYGLSVTTPRTDTHAEEHKPSYDDTHTRPGTHTHVLIPSYDVLTSQGVTHSMPNSGRSPRLRAVYDNNTSLYSPSVSGHHISSSARSQGHPSIHDPTQTYTHTAHTRTHNSSQMHGYQRMATARSCGNPAMYDHTLTGRYDTINQSRKSVDMRYFQLTPSLVSDKSGQLSALTNMSNFNSQRTDRDDNYIFNVRFENTSTNTDNSIAHTHNSPTPTEMCNMNTHTYSISPSHPQPSPTDIPHTHTDMPHTHTETDTLHTHTDVPTHTYRSYLSESNDSIFHDIENVNDIQQLRERLYTAQFLLKRNMASFEEQECRNNESVNAYRAIVIENYNLRSTVNTLLRSMCRLEEELNEAHTHTHTHNNNSSNIDDSNSDVETAHTHTHSHSNNNKHISPNMSYIDIRRHSRTHSVKDKVRTDTHAHTPHMYNSVYTQTEAHSDQRSDSVEEYGDLIGLLSKSKVANAELKTQKELLLHLVRYYEKDMRKFAPNRVIKFKKIYDLANAKFN